MTGITELNPRLMRFVVVSDCLHSASLRWHRIVRGRFDKGQVYNVLLAAYQARNLLCIFGCQVLVLPMTSCAIKGSELLLVSFCQNCSPLLEQVFSHLFGQLHVAAYARGMGHLFH